MPTSTPESKKPYKNPLLEGKNIAISKPITKAFIITGGKNAKIGRPFTVLSLKIYVSQAAQRVAEVPKSKSATLKEPILAMKQPIVSPGIAAGVNRGKMVKTSEILN